LVSKKKINAILVLTINSIQITNDCSRPSLKTNPDGTIIRNNGTYVEVLTLDRLNDNILYYTKCNFQNFKLDSEEIVKIIQYFKTEYKIKESIIPTSVSNEGFCIRCRTKMILNPDKPLCSKCYAIWSSFLYHRDAENFCHVCGKECPQSFLKPVCFRCLIHEKRKK